MQSDDQRWEHEDSEYMNWPQVTEEFLSETLDLPSCLLCTYVSAQRLLKTSRCFVLLVLEARESQGEFSQTWVSASWNRNSLQASLSVLVLTQVYFTMKKKKSSVNSWLARTWLVFFISIWHSQVTLKAFGPEGNKKKAIFIGGLNLKQNAFAVGSGCRCYKCSHCKNELL